MLGVESWEKCLQTRLETSIQTRTRQLRFTLQQKITTLIQTLAIEMHNIKKGTKKINLCLNMLHVYQNFHLALAAKKKH